MQQTKPSRPTGITVLAILAILVGLLSLSGGAYALTTVTTVSMLNQAFSGIALLVGALTLVVGIGFWSGKSWAWTLGLVTSAISIILSIAQAAVSPLGALAIVGSVPGIVVSLIILYYLTRPHVKAFFGKGPGPSIAPSKPMSQM